MEVLVSQLLPEMGFWSQKKSLKFEQQDELDLGSRLRKSRNNINVPAWNETLEKVRDEIPR